MSDYEGYRKREKRIQILEELAVVMRKIVYPTKNADPEKLGEAGVKLLKQLDETQSIPKNYDS